MIDLQDMPKIIIKNFDPESVQTILSNIEKINLSYDSTQPLLVEIDSFGGSVYGFLSIYHKLTSINRPIITYTASKAMSAGAMILSTVATPGFRFAAPHADILIHEIQAGAPFGDIKDAEDYHLNLKQMNTKCMGILAKSMGLKTAKDLRQLIKKNVEGHHWQMSAKQALKHKIIDRIGVIELVPTQYWDVIIK